MTLYKEMDENEKSNLALINYKLGEVHKKLDEVMEEIAEINEEIKGYILKSSTEMAVLKDNQQRTDRVLWVAGCFIFAELVSIAVLYFKQ